MSAALILDFDGTIVDTETALFLAWSELYARHGVDLDLELWLRTIGTDQDPDHWAVLESMVGPVDPALADWRRHRRDQLIDEAGVRPGVLRWLDDADRLDIPVGVASSSPPDWVERHLQRLGLRERFRCLACCDDVIPAKPDPTSYRHASEQLGADPARSIAVEDSPHGVAAAKDAGLFTVAVPHGLTASLDLSRADLVVASLDDLRLAEVVVWLRPARPDEHEWLFTLHEAAMRERVERVYGPWDGAFQREHFANRDPRNRVEVAVVGDRRVGAVHTRTDDDGSLLVDLLEVHPRHQGAAVGAAILRRLAGRAGRADLTLRVHRDNPASRLYERQGFVVEDRTETHQVMRRPHRSPPDA